MQAGDSERELLLNAGMPDGARMIELGCGEGENLMRLGAAPGSAGIDVATAKLRVARAALPQVIFVTANAAALPFADGAFEAALIRDLLQQVPDRQAVVNEAARVLAPGGVLVVLEASRWNPLARPSARQLARELLFAGLDDLSLSREQPLPRVLAHLGRVAAARRIVNAASNMAERLVPARLWGVLVGRARQRRD